MRRFLPYLMGGGMLFQMGGASGCQAEATQLTAGLLDGRANLTNSGLVQSSDHQGACAGTEQIVQAALGPAPAIAEQIDA